MNHEQRFKKGDRVFARLEGKRWKRGTVTGLDCYGQKGERIYSVYIASRGGAFTVPEHDMESAELSDLEV